MGDDNKNVTPLPSAPAAPAGGHGTGFSQEYVQELRQENATWRTKLREAEAIIAKYEKAEQDYIINDKVTAELTERGIEGVDPTWVDVPEGTEVKKAVDAFLEKHPNLAQPKAPANPLDGKVPERKAGPTPVPQGTKNRDTNVQPNPNGDDYATIKKDPIARAKLRDLYRGLLQQGGPTI